MSQVLRNILLGLKLGPGSPLLRDELDCYKQSLDRTEYIER